MNIVTQSHPGVLQASDNLDFSPQILMPNKMCESLRYRKIPCCSTLQVCCQDKNGEQCCICCFSLLEERKNINVKKNLKIYKTYWMLSKTLLISACLLGFFLCSQHAALLLCLNTTCHPFIPYTTICVYFANITVPLAYTNLSFWVSCCVFLKTSQWDIKLILSPSLNMYIEIMEGKVRPYTLVPSADPHTFHKTYVYNSVYT